MENATAPLLRLALCLAVASSANLLHAATFVGGLATPTGLALHPSRSELYVNSGASGKVWSVAINADGTRGRIATLTEAFTPDMEIVFDASGNLYAPLAGTESVFRLSSSGDVTSRDQSYRDLNSGITVEPPATGSKRLLYSASNEHSAQLVTLVINQFEDWSAYEDVNSCAQFDFMLYRPSVAGIAGSAGSAVHNINPSNGACSTILGGFIQASGLAEDHDNNLYVADGGTGEIVRITPLGQRQVVAQGLEGPQGLAYDPRRDRLFVSEPAAGRVRTVPLAGGSSLGAWGPGLYDSATGAFMLRDQVSPGPADHRFRFGPAGASASPLAGDWNDDGRRTIGLYNSTSGQFWLRNRNSGGRGHRSFRFGPAGAGWTAVAGDWNGNDQTTVGLYDGANGVFFLKNSLTGGAADQVFRFGPTGAILGPADRRLERRRSYDRGPVQSADRHLLSAQSARRRPRGPSLQFRPRRCRMGAGRRRLGRRRPDHSGRVQRRRRLVLPQESARRGRGGSSLCIRVREPMADPAGR